MYTQNVTYQTLPEIKAYKLAFHHMQRWVLIGLYGVLRQGKPRRDI